MGIFWSAPEKPQISHVIFDLDDTLIDTQERFFELQTECMRKFDHDFTIEDERRFQGRTAREEIKQLIGLYKLNVTEEEYFKLYELNYGRFLSHCPGLPGADSLIRHLYQAKIPLAICTNSSEPHFNVKMKSYQHWLQMIPTIVTSSDSEVKRPKPFPDPYLVTMKKFAVKPKSPKNVLVFEDSITGATSAIEAGMTVILVPLKHFNSVEMNKQIDELRPKLAAVLGSLTEFQPHEYGLPPFN